MPTGSRHALLRLANAARRDRRGGQEIPMTSKTPIPTTVAPKDKIAHPSTTSRRPASTIFASA
jgi:hypothetical protein